MRQIIVGTLLAAGLAVAGCGESQPSNLVKDADPQDIKAYMEMQDKAKEAMAEGAALESQAMKDMSTEARKGPPKEE
ncbi:hypothetical protein [Aporhodopirellula aestuarii]|uniref:Secreted protein n=1 Tax=Aporhodopirellula aestuarii TaxID=2950107 RepID=A0ABT0UD06_9BACT|nr:hypothetical protein [Aporhodopirellula aestuarii]MCM2374917.1 hypothetical protein [Aporhodopirellula aestuarii]